MIKKITLVCSLIVIALVANSQGMYNNSKFHQLEEWWPTPNEYRNGAGAPGHSYWQQKADYDIAVTLDDEKQTITGSEKITYTNNSPDALTYLWLQLDQNIYKKGSMTDLAGTRDDIQSMGFGGYNFMYNDFNGGFDIEFVKDGKGTALKYTIVNTMMRVDLPVSLKRGGQYVLQINWKYKINNTKTNGGRSGAEYFEEDKNWIDLIAQWYPRMCVYNDVQGWNHKQFIGGGEFATCFGDYNVSITAPADHVVTATGVLQNPNDVLKSEWKNRLAKAKTADKPVIIITQQEATENEKSRAKGTKTWKFSADNVRDFAWASSRKFIWDAMNVRVGNKDIMAMSFYPKEGNPLWEKYSTHSIAHTLKVYSRYTVNYPYPVAISVNGPVGGMEYPMICFNGPRPEKDGTYSSRTKYGLISVVIHEVGHNFFPMIINSDERQWAWMDEGLNTFCQYLAEQEWEEKYPSGRGEARKIVGYMSGDKATLDPIMTNAESVLQLGNNAYGKPATALNILRETVMGRELFDKAFKVYAERWAFKHPMPADFFRTMEDASGVDLDWFFRGWFYGTEPCDIALKNVKLFTVDSQNPTISKGKKKADRDKEFETISEQRNKTDIKQYLVEKYPELSDFYNTYDPLNITDSDKDKFKKYDESLTETERKQVADNKNYYILDFENIGGLVMPILIEMEFEDGTKEMKRIPAEIWRKNNVKVSKMIVTAKKVKQFSLDPLQETADINMNNNYFPAKAIESEFQLFKDQQRTREPNPMQMEKK